MTGVAAQYHPEADSLNTLVHGRRFWYFLPPDVKGFLCKKSCSEETDPLLLAQRDCNYLLPQQLHHRHHGKRLQVAVQEPGEVLYVPGRVERTVYNMETSASLIDEFVSLANAEVADVHKGLPEPVTEFYDWMKENPERVFDDDKDLRKFKALMRQKDKRRREQKRIEREFEEAVDRENKLREDLMERRRSL